MNDSSLSVQPSTSSAVDPTSAEGSTSPTDPSSAHSPNFNFLSAGNEAEKLKWLVLHHSRPSALKRMFAPLLLKKKRPVNRAEELTCVEACMLLRALEPSDTDRSKTTAELELACSSLIGLLTTEKTHLNALDRIITCIILKAYEEKILPLLTTCQLLVSSIDFRMKIPLNQEKIKFVRKSMDQLDYKNMRDLLKLLLVEKLDKMQCQLTEHQHRQLAPIEALVVDLIDRSKNYCPALFFITEISRIDPYNSSIHFLPKVSLKIREMVASFRPLAEIGSMLGRSWMWPVPASPSFSWSSQTWSAWKLDEKQCKLYFKTHLPYSSENTTPQTYLQYILFKQPHGQDNLNHILRSSTSQTPAPRIQCDEVIQLLILEAMCAMEDSEQPVLDPINQYNWLHLSHLVTHALLLQNCTLSDLLKMLLPQLRSCQYLRAKEELMWILLQLVAHARAREKNLAQQQAGQPLTGAQSAAGLGAQNRELVLEIFNVLYTEKITDWGTVCTTEKPLNMVRFFTPAAIWINLVYPPSTASSSENLPQPPEKLKSLIDFIEQQLDPADNKALAVLAVIANAYSNNKEVFEENVSSAVFRTLGYHPQQQGEKLWTLPAGRRTELNLCALDLSFLDLLTFHAKMQIYKQSIIHVFGQPFDGTTNINIASLRLPTPALTESTARLLLSTELIDAGGIFYSYLYTALKVANNPGSAEPQLYYARNDLLAMFLELLNFRLPNIGFGWKWSLDARLRFIHQVIDSLNRGVLSTLPCPSSNALQLCALLEQTLMRFVQCTWPQDLLNAIQLLSKSWMVTMPEHGRLFQLAVLRAAKLLGTDQLQLSAQELGQRWPRCELRWFPPNILHSIVPNETDLEQLEQMQAAQQAQAVMELHNLSNQEMPRLIQLDAEYFGLDSHQPNHSPSLSLLVSIFRVFYECHSVHPQPQHGKQAHPSTPSFPALCYKLLSQQSNRNLHQSTSALLDYLIWKCQGGGAQGQSGIVTGPDGTLSIQQVDPNMVAVLNNMLFVHQFVSVDRFLLLLALHPSDDSSIRASLCLLAALLDKFSSFSERLHACYAFAPAHSHTTSCNSKDFFVQMADFYKKYPEYSYAELYNKSLFDHSSYQQTQQEPSRDPQNLPIYYGHLAERIIPAVDVILQRALEVDVGPNVLEILLRNFAHLYRLHPQPMGFLYKTLYTLENPSSHHGSNIEHQIIRKFVLDIVVKLEQEEVHDARGYHYKLLTSEFVQHDHNMPPIKFCRVLVERIVQASTYTHQPPTFVHKDWRFAEFPPAAQALTSAWVELLATKHSPASIVDAFVELAIRRPIFRPQDTMNALGLLLTGLPSSFQTVFMDRIEDSFEWSQIASADADPSQLFESLSHEVYLHSNSRILSMLALIHSFCQHGGNNSLSIIQDLVTNRLAQKVENEAQLLYFLRIVVPYLQRIHEKERSKHMPEIVSIYTVLGNLVQKVGRLRYEDTICDLLYQFKYMFVGYYLKEQTETAIRNFPDSMREKLKFLLTHSSTAAAAESQQQMQQILQQQQQQAFQQMHHQSSQSSLSSVPTTAGVLSGGSSSGPPPHHFPAGQQQQPSFPVFEPVQQQQQQPASLIGMLQKQSRAEEGQQQQNQLAVQMQQGQQQQEGPSSSSAATAQQQQQHQQFHPQQMGGHLVVTSGGTALYHQQQFSMAQPMSSAASAISPNLSSSSIEPSPAASVAPSTSHQQVLPPPPYQMHPMMMAQSGSMPSQMVGFPPASSSAVVSHHQQMMMHHPHLHGHQQQQQLAYQQHHQQMMQQQQQQHMAGNPIGPLASSVSSAGASPGTFFQMGFPLHQQMPSMHQQMTPEHSSAGTMTPQIQQPSFAPHFPGSGGPNSSGNYHRNME